MTNSISYIVGRRTSRGMQYIAYWYAKEEGVAGKFLGSEGD